MAADICTAPDCGTFISDDAKPCPVCHGRGFNQSLHPRKRPKRPWTNSDWARFRNEVAAEKAEYSGE